MSAICGIIRFDERPVDHSELETMVESSPYQGPDGTGYWVHENAGFAHLAFHVTQESVGESQPLVSDDGRLVLVADVRLDNREELLGLVDRRHGRLPRPPTDCRLILAAYERWGEECVDHLLGDFVFAIWDRQKQALFLARDSLGGHSVSWHQSGSTFVFASETAAILDLPQVSPSVNQDAVLRTLAGMLPEQSDTYFESICYLPPAHCMAVSADRNRTWRYWEIDPEQRISYRSDDEYTDHFLDLLNQAVACRLRSIGPVGISLSGGSDSTLLAALAAMQLNASGQPQLKSFSYVFDRFSDCDERKYIEPVVQQYGIDAEYIQADHLWTFAALDEPEIPREFFWTNCYMQLPLSIAHAAQAAGCRILLDGMFGDALFCEPSLFAADLIRQGRITQLFKLLRSIPDGPNWKHELLDQGIRPLLPQWLRRGYRNFRPAQIDAITPGLSASRLQRLEQLGKIVNNEASRPRLSPGRATRYKRVSQAIWAQGAAATRSKPYNQCGVERESPYFDRRLVEFVLAVPTEKLSHAARPRKLQNDAMRRLLPPIVYQRTNKTGFESLLMAGLLKEEKETVRKLLDHSEIVRQGWADEQWLKNQISCASSNPSDVFALSQYLHLELWLNAIKAPLAKKARWSAPYFH